MRGHVGLCMGEALRAVSFSPPHPNQGLDASKLTLGVKMLAFDMHWLEKPQGSIKQLLHGSGFDVWGWGSKFRAWGLGAGVRSFGTGVHDFAGKIRTLAPNLSAKKQKNNVKYKGKTPDRPRGKG